VTPEVGVLGHQRETAEAARERIEPGSPATSVEEPEDLLLAPGLCSVEELPVGSEDVGSSLAQLPRSASPVG
jgi:hypothetical protein